MPTNPSVAQPAPTRARDRLGHLWGHLLDAVLAPIIAWWSGAGERRVAQRDALTVFVIRVASAGILYISQILLARWMGAAQYGVYVWMWTLVLVLGGMSHLGTGASLARLLPAYRERGEFDLLRGALVGSRWLALIMGTTVAALAYFALYALGDRLAPAYRLPALLGVACIPWYALTDVQDGLGRAQGWMGTALVPPYILRPLLVLGGMAAAHVAGLPMDAVTAAVAAIAGCWITALVQGVSVQRRVDRHVPRGPRQTAYTTWIAGSSPLLVLYASELVLQNADVLVLTAYLPPETTAMYFAAAKTMALVMFVHYAVGSAVAKDFSALHARGDRAALVAYARDAVRWTFWPSLAAAVLILTLGKPLLWLFSPHFVEAYPVMVVLVAGFLFRAAVGPAEFVLNALGEQHQCARIAAGVAGLDIALALMLVPWFGMLGAAAATAMALAASAILYARLAHRRTGLNMTIWGV